MTVQLIDSVPWEQAQAETLDFLKATGVQGVLMRVPPAFADGRLTKRTSAGCAATWRNTACS